MTGVDQRHEMYKVSFALFLLLATTAHADQVAPSDIEAVDGGTIRVRGNVVHIVGIDTPKLGQRAHCGLERMLAARAVSRLRQIIRSGSDIELDKVICSCRAGSGGVMTCNEGQDCGDLTVDGADVGDILIAENLARPHVCNSDECPRPKPWCPFETE